MWITILLLGFAGIWDDSKYIIAYPMRWHENEWVLATGIGVETGWVMLNDENIQGFIQKHREDDIAGFFEPLGSEGAILVAGGFWLEGVIFKDKKAEQVGEMGIKSILISGAIVSGIKILCGRARPYKNEGAFEWSGIGTSGDRFSFPSGHTTTAFSLASVVSETYKNRFVSFLAYGVAGGVAWSRVNDNCHWTSDVIVGAVIGTAVGKMLANREKSKR